ncbi:GSCFA domain-containing protein [Vreelandella titanicae]|uniref:GSCFA domain-containing protein n=1 Tax=Vreelandella titanicae TaxID=664683 RepID=A0A558JDC3_9GAMM|nr:GSCFA domain-containing protein [Halomonas titanicae]TVU91624.1 GSCFA domain-containing protein [Halomonas titanicae]
MNNAYKELEKKCFWNPSVGNINPLDIQQVCNPKFKIEKSDKIATYGSCFAQHIGKNLKQRNFDWLITEKAPEFISKELREEYNYGAFSARTGNIYTTTLLRQWIKNSINNQSIVEVWKKNNRYYDLFRPTIEPNGFSSENELIASIRHTENCFKQSITNCNIFIFTLGLTESWMNIENGFEYPISPGVAAGEFDPYKHIFINQNYQIVYNSLEESISELKKINKDIKIILTVSPVPLVATKTDKHILAANTYSKSTLRAVAGDLANKLSYVEYFPSFEIINSHIFRGIFFNNNQRTVNPHGVDFVMNHFFNSFFRSDCKKHPKSELTNKCDEELIEAFKKS